MCMLAIYKCSFIILRSFAPFSTRLFDFFSSYFVGVRHICYTTLLLNRCVTNIIHSVVCVFTSLCFLILTQSDLLVIAFLVNFPYVSLWLFYLLHLAPSKWDYAPSKIDFLQCERGVNSFYFSPHRIQLIQHHLLKRPSFPTALQHCLSH